MIIPKPGLARIKYDYAMIAAIALTATTRKDVPAVIAERPSKKFKNRFASRRKLSRLR